MDAGMAGGEIGAGAEMGGTVLAFDRVVGLA
jgi:hypothetical protein